jgi:DNA-binding CsgD family transcriptional regulator
LENKDINTFIEKAFSHFEKDRKDKIDLNFLKNKRLSDNECLYLFDFPQNRILYKTGFLNCLGYDDETITFDFLFNNIHPDDVKLVKRITRISVQYSLDNPTNSSDNQLFITYRHKTAKGNYIKILNQVTVFGVDKNNQLKTVLIRLLDISFLDKTNIVNWTFRTSDLDEDAFKKKIYKHNQNIFTPREKELIREIVKGSANKEIGALFRISEHTVATHRKNILKKSGCHNFIELEIFCKGKGIL